MRAKEKETEGARFMTTVEMWNKTASGNFIKKQSRQQYSAMTFFYSIIASTTKTSSYRSETEGRVKYTTRCIIIK